MENALDKLLPSKLDIQMNIGEKNPTNDQCEGWEIICLKMLVNNCLYYTCIYISLKNKA